jgi:murein DD-endopeptidase MepM/ murein hydrolase activator NlpD
MRTTKILFSTICTFILSTSAFAQFNTIGTYNHKRIKTENPSKPVEATTDSISMKDSISEPTKIEMVGESSSYQTENVTSLVSLPLKSIHIGSGFGMRMHPIYHKRMMHNGIDLSARYESVYSMFPGTVIKVGQDSRSGKFVTVKTGDYTISYCHLSQQYVNVNDFVYAGTIIACSGNTGASTGPHLHLTTKKDGKAFNPTILLEYIESTIDN